MTQAAGNVAYKRILLKLSGGALIGDEPSGIDPHIISRIAHEVKEVSDLGVQVALVVGGGNLFRGQTLAKLGLDRITADHIGMLSTIMNAIAMRDVFEKINLSCRVMSAIALSGLVDFFDRRKAIYHLTQQRVVIFTGGTGNPLVTTDSAASLRGIEINADIVLKATDVNGIYSDDPMKNQASVLYQHLTYQEALDKELGVMDLAAFCQCRDFNMPLRVFNIHKQGSLLRIVQGHNEGTLVSKGAE